MILQFWTIVLQIFELSSTILNIILHLPERKKQDFRPRERRHRSGIVPSDSIRFWFLSIRFEIESKNVSIHLQAMDNYNLVRHVIAINMQITVIKNGRTRFRERFCKWSFAITSYHLILQVRDRFIKNDRIFIILIGFIKIASLLSK